MRCFMTSWERDNAVAGHSYTREPGAECTSPEFAEAEAEEHKLP